VLQTPGVEGWLVHAVEDGPTRRVSEACDEGVVGVDDHRTIGRQVPEGRGDNLAGVGKLTVAVELVPEEVQDGEGPYLRLGGHLRHARLVDLEEPHL
jgi:hypothetical protein